MDDDEIFERSMASLGVEPLDRDRDASIEKRLGDDAESDRRLLAASMRQIDGVDRLQGDCHEGDRGITDRRARTRRQTVQRVKLRAKNPRIDEQLDLHRLKSEEALVQLDRFVAEAVAAGGRTVLVITGKGVHSPGGRSVLKHRVEEWIQGRGRHLVRAFSEAPRHLGGRGAYVLFLWPAG